MDAAAVNPFFPYDVAPPGSPDRYRLVEASTAVWTGAPRRYAELIDTPFIAQDGMLSSEVDACGENVLTLQIRPPFFFSISVAPDDPRAEPAACVHDWLYKHAEELAKWYGVSPKEIMRMADRWFLALLRHYAFPYSSLYFRGVSLFGYAYHVTCKWLGGIFG